MNQTDINKYSNFSIKRDIITARLNERRRLRTVSSEHRNYGSMNCRTLSIPMSPAPNKLPLFLARKSMVNRNSLSYNKTFKLVYPNSSDYSRSLRTATRVLNKFNPRNINKIYRGNYEDHSMHRETLTTKLRTRFSQKLRNESISTSEAIKTMQKKQIKAYYCK